MGRVTIAANGHFGFALLKYPPVDAAGIVGDKRLAVSHAAGDFRRIQMAVQTYLDFVFPRNRGTRIGDLMNIVFPVTIRASGRANKTFRQGLAVFRMNKLGGFRFVARGAGTPDVLTVHPGLQRVGRINPMTPMTIGTFDDRRMNALPVTQNEFQTLMIHTGMDKLFLAVAGKAARRVHRFGLVRGVAIPARRPVGNPSVNAGLHYPKCPFVTIPAPPDQNGSLLRCMKIPVTGTTTELPGVGTAGENSGNLLMAVTTVHRRNPGAVRQCVGIKPLMAIHALLSAVGGALIP